MIARRLAAAAMAVSMMTLATASADDRLLAGVREYPTGVVWALVDLHRQPHLLGQPAKQCGAPADARRAIRSIATGPDAGMRALADAPAAAWIALDHPSQWAALAGLFDGTREQALERLLELRERFDAEDRAAAAAWRQRIGSDYIALGEYRDLVNALTREAFADMQDPPVVVVLDRAAYAACPPSELVIEALLERAESTSLQSLLREWWGRYGTDRRDERALRHTAGRARSAALPIVSTGAAKRWRAIQPGDDLQRLDLLPILLLPRTELDAAERMERASYEHARLWGAVAANQEPNPPTVARAESSQPSVVDRDSYSATGVIGQMPAHVSDDYASAYTAGLNGGVIVAADQRSIVYGGGVHHTRYVDDGLGYDCPSTTILPQSTLYVGSSSYGRTTGWEGGGGFVSTGYHIRRIDDSCRDGSIGGGFRLSASIHGTPRYSASHCSTPRYPVAHCDTLRRSISFRNDCDRGLVLPTVLPGFVSATASYHSFLRGRDCDRGRYTRPYVAALNPFGYPLPGNPRADDCDRGTRDRRQFGGTHSLPTVRTGVSSLSLRGGTTPAVRDAGRSPSRTIAPHRIESSGGRHEARPSSGDSRRGASATPIRGSSPASQSQFVPQRTAQSSVGATVNPLRAVGGSKQATVNPLRAVGGSKPATVNPLRSAASSSRSTATRLPAATDRSARAAGPQRSASNTPRYTASPQRSASAPGRSAPPPPRAASVGASAPRNTGTASVSGGSGAKVPRSASTPGRSASARSAQPARQPAAPSRPAAPPRSGSKR
ncbi:MAG: hypothetical protein IPM64_10135 [Phycisphaerales bacterium]|nr:hypothetical protein [Phycisphaerales bacterium]